MLNPLLKTKTTIPLARGQVVFRTRLYAVLNEFMVGAGPLMLISAKAGAGKSSLISQWLHRS